MSFNIRYDNPEDSLDNWRYRKDRVANAIHFYDVDILGTQEVLHNQLEDLKLRLPEYGVVGVGREDVKRKGNTVHFGIRRIVSTCLIQDISG